MRLQWFPVTPDEYILGLSDLSGELMRFCLNGSRLPLSCLEGSLAHAMQAD
jgi:predicted translin family RNA/ssDNA-binding protein